MAITVNGRILRNLPEQVSKNTEDIIELQNVSNNHEIRITALEAGAIALATFQDCTFTGTTTFSGPLNSSNGFTFGDDGYVAGDLSVGGDLAVTGSSTFTGTVTASGNENVGGDLAVTGNITMGDAQVGKKIYIHPINLFYYEDDNNYASLTVLIFNNDETPFTFDTFKRYIVDLSYQVGSAIRILASGSYKVGGSDPYPACYLYSGGGSFYVVGIPGDTSVAQNQLSLGSFDEAKIEVFADGVNAIN